MNYSKPFLLPIQENLELIEASNDAFSRKGKKD